jgi:hypothetical protein
MENSILAETPHVRLTDIRRAVLLAAALSPAAVVAAARQHLAYDQDYDAESRHDLLRIPQETMEQ